MGRRPAIRVRRRSRILAAQKIFGRLSPGSPFVASECGRHLAWENLLVTIDGRGLVVVAAYFMDDVGENSSALINRYVFSQAPVLDLTRIRSWEDPIHSHEFIPPGEGRGLEGTVGWTREWVQTNAARGWDLPPAAPGGGEVPALSVGSAPFGRERKGGA